MIEVSKTKLLCNMFNNSNKNPTAKFMIKQQTAKIIADNNNRQPLQTTGS